MMFLSWLFNRLFSRFLDRFLKLPPALSRKVEVRRNLRTLMPDGVELLADLYVPSTTKNPPTILVRTPYGRLGLLSRLISRPFAERGYQVLIQAARGTDGSGGMFDPFIDERADGLATLDWIEKQPWFHGNLLCFGASYLGYVQWAIAPDAGTRITAMMPVITTANFHDTFNPGGVLVLSSSLAWTKRMVTGERSALLADLGEMLGDKRAKAAMWHLPLKDADAQATGKRLHWWQPWLAKDAAERYWGGQRDHRSRIGEVAIPVAMFTGWWDLILRDQLDDYAAMRAAGRNPQLIIGPWLHADIAGLAASMRKALEWFPRQIAGKHAAVQEQPVRLYVQGAGEWRDFADWPIPGAQARSWYLQPGGKLTPEPASEASAPARFRYDPNDPTPDDGGAILDPRTGGRKDQVAREARADVLVYTSEPLAQPFEAIGPVSAQIILRSSDEHCDIFVRVCDVDRQGRRSMSVTAFSGSRRSRSRATRIVCGRCRSSSGPPPIDSRAGTAFAYRFPAARFRALPETRVPVSHSAMPANCSR